MRLKWLSVIGLGIFLFTCTEELKLNDSLSNLKSADTYRADNKAMLIGHLPGVQNLVVHDLDNDGDDEIFLVSNKYRRSDNVLIRLYEEKVEFFQIAFDGYIFPDIYFSDYNNDGTDEIHLITMNEHLLVTFYVLDKDGNELLKLPLGELDEIESTDPNFLKQKPMFKTVNPEPERELLIIPITGTFGYLFAVDLQQEKLQWQRKTLGISEIGCIKAANLIGKIAVLANPKNKDISLDGLTDNCAWLYYLDDHGKNVIRPKNIGGRVSRNTLLFKEEGLWVFSSPFSDDSLSSLYELDLEKYELHLLSRFNGNFNGRALEWKNSGNPNIYAVIGEIGGDLLVFNREGKLYHTLDDISNLILQPEDLIDVEKDGINELIIGTKIAGIHVLNNRFERLFRTKNTVYLTKTIDKETNHVKIITYPVVLTKNNYVMVSGYSKIPIDLELYFIRAGLLLLLLLFIVFMLYVLRKIKNRTLLFLNIFDTMANSGIIISPRGKIVYVNLTFQHLFPDVEFKSGKSDVHTVLAKAKYRELRGFIAAALKDKNPHEHQLVLPVNRRNREFMLQIKPFGNGNLSGLIYAELVDLSGQKQTEQEQLWTQVARDIAHKVKTPLSTIMLAFNNIKKVYQRAGISGNEKLDLIIDNAASEVERIREHAKALMLLARAGDSRPGIVQPELIVAQVADFYSSYFEKGITLKYDYPDPVPAIYANEQDIRNVIENIFANSLAAMKNDGTILVSIQQQQNLNGDVIPADRVMIEISDNGAGIPKENLDKIFEPYFTTKSEGTGLGMVIVRRLVEIQGGNIAIHSREGIGTTVTLVFSMPETEENGAGDGTDSNH